MEIVHVDFVHDGVVAEFVGLAIGDAALEAAAGEPDAEAGGIVIAPRAVLLGVGRAAKFAAPPDDRVFEQPALFQVVEQPGDRLVHGLGVVAVFLEIRVLVPRGVVGVVAVVHLHEAHARFAQPPREQALPAEVVRLVLADAVERQRLGAFAVEIEHLGRGALHAPGEFVAVDHRFEFALAGLLRELLGIQVAQQVELPLRLLRRARGLEIADRRFLRRHARAADRRALIDRGQKGVAVIARAAVAEARAERDEAGQILVFRAEPVGDPRAHRGPHEGRRAGVEKERGRAVRDAVGVHRADRCKDHPRASPSPGKDPRPRGRSGRAGQNSRATSSRAAAGSCRSWRARADPRNRASSRRPHPAAACSRRNPRGSRRLA